MHAPLMYIGMYVPTYLNQLISLTDTQQARSAVVEEVFAHNREQHIFSGLGKHSLQQVTVRHKEILILHISKTTPILLYTSVITSTVLPLEIRIACNHTSHVWCICR